MSSTLFVNNSTLLVADWHNDVDTAVYNTLSSVAGTNTITGTGPTSLTSYASGQVFKFVPANDNTGATTLNISALGAKNIYWNGAALSGGELQASVPVTVYYDGTQFNILANGSNIPVGLINAKGDVLVGTAADTVARKAVGSDGQVLVADSTQSDGLAWSSVGFTTGDVKLTLKTTADTGWVLMDDKTIGDASSGATGRANADTQALFTLLWNNTADAQCAVSTGRGASAAADFAAHKTIALPKALGRALATYGAGSGLTSRVLALATGSETHALSSGELPSITLHTTAAANNTPGGNVNFWAGDNSGGTAGLNTDASGTAGTAHNNMQPTLFLNTMIKL